MRLKTWHCLAFLALAVLLVYYPGLHAGYNSIDDLKMVNRVEQSGPLDLAHIFVRKGSYYYRPLTILSYTLDRDVWGSIAGPMHLESILLHLVCAFLVYAITRHLLLLWGEEGQGIALFSGLFFALHPLATESVCWISGRTDPLMTVFLLLAVWLTMVALSTGRPLTSLAGGVALFLACLAKEVAVFVLPGLLWLILVYPGADGWLGRLRRRWWLAVMPAAGVAGYFVLRHLAIARDSGISTALKGVTGGDFDLLNKMRIALKVYGFYFKKLLVPWPLNYAITDVSGWYVLAGVVLAGVLIYLTWRADVLGAFGLMAFFVLSPALLVVFGKMTWTPFAERYLFAPVALSSPLFGRLVLRVRTLPVFSAGRRLNLALLVLLLVFFGTTLHRAWIWQDNLRLYQDTVAKNPDFAAAKTELASALLRQGKEDQAQAILAGMQGEKVAPDYINDDMRLAGMLLAKGDLDGARQVLIPVINKNPKKRFQVLQLLIRINDQRLGRGKNLAEKMAIQEESLNWLLVQQQIRPRAFILYRIGKKYLALGKEGLALEYFKKAYAKAPQDAFYRGPAATLIRRLEGT